MKYEHCTICHTEVEVCETCNVKKHHACQTVAPYGLNSWQCATCQAWIPYGTSHVCYFSTPYQYVAR